MVEELRTMIRDHRIQWLQDIALVDRMYGDYGEGQGTLKQG